MTEVAFIGMGRMGRAMALKLMAAGHRVAVFNRTAERCGPLIDAGARLAESAAAAAAGAEITITMLVDGDAVSGVLTGPEGVVAAARPGGIVVDMSTVGPATASELATECRRAGLRLLDAPVSGSVTTAEAAQITTMVGGARTAFEPARPLLTDMTRAQIYAGASGAGAAMKLALNLIMALTGEAVDECLELAEAA